MAAFGIGRNVGKKKVATRQIESELEALWEAMPGAEKVKAALFTLIAYVEDPERLEHTECLLKHVLGRYPCRVLLLREEPGQKEVEVSVSLELVGDGQTQVTCDQIEVLFPPAKKGEIPFLVLPHLLSNVPVCLLWKGRPSPSDTVYTLLKGVVNRLVIDPENLDQAQYAGELWANLHAELIDLKWASIAGWRQLLAKVFGDPACIDAVCAPAELTIRVAGGAGLSALYLQAWLVGQLGWDKRGTITPVPDTPYSYGAVLGIELTTKGGYHFNLNLEPSGEFVRVEASSPEWCEIPCSHYIGPFRREEIFAKELFRERPSPHYPEMLKHLPWKETAYAH